ncbi:hypothetical protein KY349_00165, partial [Candidatus Woesearchaeota archaeon]|nr:hypothetical protein [Candidatus Woesearchaeota archaeon]
KEADCKELDASGAGICAQGLICCKTPKEKEGLGNTCGPNMGRADIPKCLEPCKGTEYEDGTSFCTSGKCCVNTIKCSEEEDSQLKGLVKDSKLVTKLKSTDASTGQESLLSCDPGSICLLGVTDSMKNSFTYGKCIRLEHPLSLAYYCKHMSESTCKATSGIALEFLNACKAQNLATACAS